MQNKDSKLGTHFSKACFVDDKIKQTWTIQLSVSVFLWLIEQESGIHYDILCIDFIYFMYAPPSPSLALFLLLLELCLELVPICFHVLILIFI